jgi:hypothetical protein
MQGEEKHMVYKSPFSPVKKNCHEVGKIHRFQVNHTPGIAAFNVHLGVSKTRLHLNPTLFFKRSSSYSEKY